MLARPPFPAHAAGPGRFFAVKAEPSSQRQRVLQWLDCPAILGCLSRVRCFPPHSPPWRDGAIRARYCRIDRIGPVRDPKATGARRDRRLFDACRPSRQPWPPLRAALGAALHPQDGGHVGRIPARLFTVVKSSLADLLPRCRAGPDQDGLAAVHPWDWK